MKIFKRLLALYIVFGILAVISIYLYTKFMVNSLFI